MSTLSIRRIALVLFAGHIMLSPALAQQREAPMPPKLEPLEEGNLPPEAAPAPEPTREINETRTKGGKVSEVTVSKGTNTYVLRPNEQAGSAMPGDGQSSTLRGAQWQIFQFDLRRPEDKTRDAPAAEAEGGPAPVPPPPRP